MSGNKVLARALVKLAIAEDKQVAINAADAAQFCGAGVCRNAEMSEAETIEIRAWLKSKIIECELLS